jgi:S-methylmethionine-dependent homocysteine/selenocysteine methylase
MNHARPIFSKAAKKAGIFFGCYPNVSEKLPDGLWNLRASNSNRMSLCAVSWMKEGAVMVGSCCHSTPRTTSAIRSKRDIFYIAKDEAELGVEFGLDKDEDLPEEFLW